MGDIANNWKELSGERNWEGLMKPLNNNLRKYIIHYGERVQAIYDTFSGDTAPQFRPSAPENLFSKAGLEKGNPYKYTVTNYLYGLSDNASWLDWAVEDRSSWIGYVAVATDEGKAALGRRDILICWRGTQLVAEWFKDFNIDDISIDPRILNKFHNDEAKVHEGFLTLYTSSNDNTKYNKYSAREQVLSAVQTLVDKYRDEKEVSITITGHSLGAALATLCAADIVANGHNKPSESNIEHMVTAFVFASPKVGNSVFKNIFNGLKNLHLLHIRDQYDIVPVFPIIIFVEVGNELRINATKSKYLKPHNNFLKRLVVAHNLEIYLHGVAGEEVHRDISLVNKYLDALKEEFRIPAEWWDQKKNNKGMVQQEDGSWKRVEARL